MASDESGDEDLLLERLQQATSGDAAIRQLRRRYDLLRRDYELLIDRLGELEDRLAESRKGEEQGPSPALAQPAERPGVSANPLQDGIVAPLLGLRDDYMAAVGGIQSIVSGLESLAAAAFKGQRGAAPVATAGSHERPRLRPQKINVDVKGGGFGELLDFQERLSALAGVARVSINAIDNERATLVVELESTEAGD